MFENFKKEKILNYLLRATAIIGFACTVSSAEMWASSQEKQKLHVCTVASFQNHELDILRESALAHGLEIEVAGMDRPLRNNLVKLYRMQEHLETLPTNDIVLFVDASDVLILGNEDQIIEQYKKMNIPCLFSAEKRLYPKDPLAGLKVKYPVSDTSFRYLNSGCYIGEVTPLRLMISEILSDRYNIPLTRFRRINNDQLHCHRFFAQNPWIAKIDTRNEIFLTLSEVKKEELIIDDKEKSVRVIETGNKPLVIHANVSGKPLYEEIVKALSD